MMRPATSGVASKQFLKAALLAGVLIMGVWPAHSQTSTAKSSDLQPLAITFDDLPAHGKHPSSVSRLQIIQTFLATMRSEKLPPIYGFINGYRTEDEPSTIDVLKAWRAAGQPLANHTWSHPDLDDTSSDQFIHNIQANQPLLRTFMPETTDDWHWFRYPYLNEGNTLDKHREVRTWLKENHYKVAEVTLDWDDWAWNEPYTRCSAKNDSAGVKALHDSYLSSADIAISHYRDSSQRVYNRQIPFILLLHVGAFDARMFPELVALFRERGFRFVTLPDASADPAYSEDSDMAYDHGDTFIDQIAYKRHTSLRHDSRPVEVLQTVCR